MKKGKLNRLVACIAVAALLLSSLCMTAMASGTPTVTLSSGTTRAGESLTLTVSIEDNPGLAALMLHLRYDKSVFTVDAEDGVVAEGQFASSGSVVCAETEKGVNLLWFNGSGRNVTADGKVISITLHAAADAANGSYSVKLDCDSENTVNSNEQSVELAVVSGTITVTGGTADATPAPEEETITFTDIDGHWAEDAILKSAELGLVNGMGDGLYCPDDTMTRAMCVTILWRAAGCPEPAGEASFTDLTQSWYRKAVAWAEENAVVNGVGGGKFNPNGAVSREQLVTILHRMAGTPVGGELMFASQYDASHPDSGQVSSWAKNAVYWAIYKNILCGDASEDLNSGAELNPTDPATRAQIAVMMVRYLDKY